MSEPSVIDSVNCSIRSYDIVHSETLEVTPRRKITWREFWDDVRRIFFHIPDKSISECNQDISMLLKSRSDNQSIWHCDDWGLLQNQISAVFQSVNHEKHKTLL